MAARDLKAIAVIPVRMSSSRLPGKPLKDIGGKTLVRRVWEQANASNCLSRVLVTTDSSDIEEEVRNFGGNVVITGSDITTGTQRVAEALAQIGSVGWDVVVNVQGDMPFLKAEVIDAALGFFADNFSRFDMVTAATPIYSRETFLSPADVKVVVNENGEALYFSRAPIPYSRDGALLRADIEGRECLGILGFKHFGLYLFKPHALNLFRSAELSKLESVEMLEQLRLLDRGFRIGVCLLHPDRTAGFVEVDTDADLRKAREIALD